MILTIAPQKTIEKYDLHSKSGLVDWLQLKEGIMKDYADKSCYRRAETVLGVAFVFFAACAWILAAVGGVHMLLNWLQGL